MEISIAEGSQQPKPCSTARIVDREDPIEAMDRLITFARRRFQFLSVLYLDSAPKVFNGSRFLQNASGKAHAGASCAEHLRQELMGDGEQFRIHAVLAHEQPTCQPLFDLM